MVPVLTRLLHDEVGSTVGSEFALVTSVTVGALLLGVSDFAVSVNRRFETVSKSPALQMSKLEKQREEEAEQRRAQFEQQRAKAAARRNHQSALGDTATP